MLWEEKYNARAQPDRLLIEHFHPMIHARHDRPPPPQRPNRAKKQIFERITVKNAGKILLPVTLSTIENSVAC